MGSNIEILHLIYSVQYDFQSSSDLIFILTLVRYRNLIYLLTYLNVKKNMLAEVEFHEELQLKTIFL